MDWQSYKWQVGGNAETAGSMETRHITLAPLANGGKKITLRFDGVSHTRESFVVRVFLNAPGADAATPTRGNDHFAGKVYLYGHGMAIPGNGGGEAAPPPFDTFIDISAAAARVLHAGAPVDVTLVVVDNHGKGLPAGLFEFTRAYLDAGD
jgi:tyrosinase